MNSFVKIYRKNIYGIIGTLIFHILLFSAFILSDVNMKGKAKEEAILIEFPDIAPLEEEISEDKESNENSNEENVSRSDVSNLASNRLASQQSTSSVEEFLDAEYLKEIEEARKLVSDVNNQLSKEVVDIEDIKMPVRNTEGLDTDSIKNISYTGDSNIEYFLEDRFVISLPVPVYLSQSGGKVIVDIEVNRDGRVTVANPQKSNEIRNEQIYNYARAAALNTIFNADRNAPQSQKGSIHYTFISQ